MNSADRLIELFHAACQQPAGAERREFVESCCGGEASFREQLLSLLEAHGEAGNYLSHAALTDALPGERPGDRIGRYLLLQKIGEGGCGTVYLAEQEEPVRRRVALKVILPGMDTRQVVARFEAERQALALMDHPNIAKVFDAGATAAGRPFFVMELVPGEKITDYCDRNHLTTEARLQLLTQVCHAIQHAHQKGIIHRDIKPSNILVAENDGAAVPKVIDFGIAKATEQRLTSQTVLTLFEQFIGTPAYMSPEQATMTIPDIDTRSDIYSLGVLLYELLTGKTPFDAEQLVGAGLEQIRRIIREEDPPKPSTRLSTMARKDLITAAESRCLEPPKLLERVRGDLDWIVLKCLEKDRTRRYETVSGLARDIEHYLKDEPVLATPPSAGYRVRKFVRRHRGPVVAGSLLLLALVAGIVGTTWGMMRAHRAESAALRERDDREEQLWHSLVAQAHANRLSDRPGKRFATLEILERAAAIARARGSPPEKLQDLRNGVAAALALPDLHLRPTAVRWPENGGAFTFDDTHTLCACTDLDGACSVRRTADGAELCRLPATGGSVQPVFGPGGKFLALRLLNKTGARSLSVQVWELAPAPRPAVTVEDAWHVAFRGAGEAVIVLNDGSLERYALPDGKRLGALPAGPFTREVNIALHPTEPLVAMASYFTPVLEVRHLESGEVVAALRDYKRVTSVAWSPDGKQLAAARGEAHGIILYDRTTWQTVRTLETQQTVSMLSFNDDGSQLATNGWQGMLEVFDTSRGESLITVKGGETSPSLVWKGRHLAGGVREGRAALWEVADGRECRTFVRRGAPAHTHYKLAALHPNSRWLAVWMDDGIWFLDVTDGRELAFVALSAPNLQLLFESSGDLLVMTEEKLERWPLTEAEGALRIGPPLPLEARGRHCLGQSRDGQVIVTANRALMAHEARAGGWIQPAGGAEPLRLDAGADISRIAVSPDGQWVVTATHSPGDARLWTRGGEFVRILMERGAGWMLPVFSADGRWLALGGGGGRVFSTETWQPGPPVGEKGMFAPDARMIAVPLPAGIRLVEYTTGREIALLENGSLNAPRSLHFTGHGAALVSLDVARGVSVWDLRLLREQLQARGLDWEWPEIP